MVPSARPIGHGLMRNIDRAEVEIELQKHHNPQPLATCTSQILTLK